MTTLDEVLLELVDCEHKSAPIDDIGEHFAVGTRAMAGNRIDYSQARRISHGTFLSWTRRMEPQAGDILLAREAPVGPVVRIPHTGNVAPGQRTVLMRPDKRATDSDYLFFALTAPATQSALLEKAAGSTVAHLNVADIRSFSFPWDFPAVVTQRAIAEVLGVLDDKIAANQSMSAVAVELMLAQVQTWAAGSGVVPLSALATSKTVQVTPSQMGAVAHFSLPAFDAGEMPAEDSGESIKSNKLTISAPSVLMSRLNPRIPRVWDIPELPSARAVASTEFVVLEPKDLPTGALWAVLSQDSVIQRLQELARGTSGSHQRVRPSEALAVEVPDVRLLSGRQKASLGDLSRRRWLARNESRHLATLRDTLLPHLMSGRLTVREAEETVESAL